MRVLLDDLTGRPLGAEVAAGDLPELYAPAASSWIRANMVTTLDGSATGPDGRSGSIGNAADKQVFHTLRGLADAVVVGAGTARTEGYGPAPTPIVVVSRRGDVPDRLASTRDGSVVLATTEQAPGLDVARDRLGADNVLTAGADTVDLPVLRDLLAERGWRHLLTEGGPSLLNAFLEADLVDELCLTTVPRLVGGDNPGLDDGGPLDVPLDIRLLLEEEGTFLGRWFVQR